MIVIASVVYAVLLAFALALIKVAKNADRRMAAMSASITCPRCGATSYHPEDIRNGYCGRCHWWTSDPDLGQIEPPDPIETQQ